MKYIALIILMLISINTFAQKYNDYLDSAKLKFSQEKYFDAYEFYKAAKVYGKNLPSIVAQSEEGIDKSIVAIKRQKEISDSLYIVANEEKIKTQTALNKADSALNIANTIVNAMYFYDDKLALAYNGEKWGYINKKGEVMIDFLYYEAEMFAEESGFAKVKDIQGEYLIDTSGNKYLYANNKILSASV